MPLWIIPAALCVIAAAGALAWLLARFDQES